MSLGILISINSYFASKDLFLSYHSFNQCSQCSRCSLLALDCWPDHGHTRTHTHIAQPSIKVLFFLMEFLLIFKSGQLLLEAIRALRAK